MLKSKYYLNKKYNKISIDELEYIPLPESPYPWNADGRDFFSKFDSDKYTRSIIESYWHKNYEKVIDLIKNLNMKDRSNNINTIYYLSYRHIISWLVKRNKFKTALSLYNDMFNEISEFVSEKDRKKYSMISDAFELGINKDENLEYVYQKEYRSLFKLDVYLSKYAKINNIEKIPLSERIKKYFKNYEIINDVILFFDKKGMILKKNMRSKKEYVLDHDIWSYDLDFNYNYIIILSTNCSLYIYDINIHLLFTLDLSKESRLFKHFKENQPSWKNSNKFDFLNSMSLNYGKKLIIFNIVHELIFYNLEGEILYVISMPTIKSWEDYIFSSNAEANTSDIQNALKTLGLKLPVDYDQIKSKYKQLSFKFHPDLNPNLFDAKKRMQEINNAFSMLTGLDPKSINKRTSNLPFFYYLNRDNYIIKGDKPDSKLRYFHERTQDEIIYIKVNNDDDSVYVSTLTNKVYQFYQFTPLRVFDLGEHNSVVNIRFVHNYILFSTDTRLYILNKKFQLINFINHYKESLHIFDRSFCLINNYYARFFDFSGNMLAELRTEYIITAVYPYESDFVIETRQHRAHFNLY